MTDLGTLGGTGSRAYAINDSGQIVGGSTTASGQSHAFLYSGGVMTDLGTLGGTDSTAYGINDSGQIVGGSSIASNNIHAFLYSGGVMTDLGTLGGTTISAYGINNSGQIVGESTTASGQTHAFIYSGGTMTDLGTLGGTGSRAYAINDSGQIVGDSFTASGQTHAFLYSGGVMTDLGTLGGTTSLAHGINNSGQIVGESATASGQIHVFLFSGGVMLDLGTPGGIICSAVGINDNGQIVGSYEEDVLEQHAFLYSGGQMTDLGTLGGTDSAAYGINDSGQIVGQASTDSGQYHAFLYNPEVFNAVLSVSPASLSPSCVEGQNADSQSFTVQNTGNGTLSYSITKDQTWFSCTPTSGTSTGEQDTIAVNYATGMAAGTYTGTITVTAPGASGTPKTISVTLTVTAPVLSVSPASLRPTCVQGQNAVSQSFTIQNTGVGTLSYSITKDQTWFSCTPTSGTSTGEQDTITVSYATSGLAAGTYNGTITVTAPGATGTPKTIGVALTVTPPPPPPVLSVSPTSLSPSCVQGQNAASQSFTVQNTGGGTLSYNITKDAAWLSVTPTSGTSTGEQDSITVNYATSGLAVGTYQGVISISATGVSNSPQQITAVVQVNGSAHIITASAGTNGTISPAGTVSVNYGASQTFGITPAVNYHVADVLVDGTSVGAVTSYTFDNVITAYTIAASFAIDTRTITATAGAHGIITPSGALQVNYGASQSFTIRPNTNYNIKMVLVDGMSAGPVSSYTINNITADHAITASFVATTVSILTDKDQVRVPTGKTASLYVKLSDEPQANVTVTAARKSGSPALSLQGGATLTFTPANWNTYQVVQIAATPDKNDMNATAAFELSAPGQTGKQVTAVKGQAGMKIGSILQLLLDK
ncbi:MAG: BACON domain-containing protein [Desulfobaccales bacterium]